MRLFVFFAFIATILFLTAPAYAACTNPAEPEGALVYNKDYKVVVFCDGTNWVSMAGGGGGGGGVVVKNLEPTVALGGTWTPPAGEKVISVFGYCNVYGNTYSCTATWKDGGGTAIGGSVVVCGHSGSVGGWIRGMRTIGWKAGAASLTTSCTANANGYLYAYSVSGG